MKTIIWDFNGTILDDAIICLETEQDMLKRRGMRYDYSLDEYRHLFTFPVVDYYKELGFTFEDESYDEVSVDFINTYNSHSDEFKCCDGIVDKLKEAKAKGFNNVILSASKLENLLEQCEMLNITDYFSEILGTTDIYAHGKIDMAQEWMERGHIDKDQTIFIGDCVHDIDVAKALGVKCISISTGHQAKDILQQHNDKVIDNIKELDLDKL